MFYSVLFTGLMQLESIEKYYNIVIRDDSTIRNSTINRKELIETDNDSIERRMLHYCSL